MSVELAGLLTSGPKPEPFYERSRLVDGRGRTDSIFQLIDRDAYYFHPIAGKDRLLFYLANLEVFDWNHIARNGLGKQAFHPRFDALFSESNESATLSLSALPSVDEVFAYVAELRATVDTLIPQAPPEKMNMAIEHRELYTEDLVNLLHELSPEWKKAAVRGPVPRPARSAENPMIEIPGGKVVLGRAPWEFGWDNEFPAHTVNVEAFKVSRYKISNLELLPYVVETGDKPHLWFQKGQQWWFRGIFEDMPMGWNWPAIVTQRQARGYAAWRGVRLMSEAEIHRAAFGDSGISPETSLVDFESWYPADVEATPWAESVFSVCQLVGNGWEWTSTKFAPFPGFIPMTGYEKYSTNCFDNAHYVLKGASWVTPRGLVRPSFRKCSRDDNPHIYGTFRLASSV